MCSLLSLSKGASHGHQDPNRGGGPVSSTVFQGWIPMGKGEASEQEGTRKLLWVEGSIWGQGWGGGGQVTFPSRKVLAPALNRVQASVLQPAEPQREPAELCVSAIMSHKIK